MIDVVLPKNNEEEFVVMSQKLGIKLLFLYPEEKKNSCLLTHNVLLRSSVPTFYAGEDIRKALESPGIHVVYNSECSPKKDSLHYRNSGLNQVLCAIAKKKNKIIAFNIGSLLNSSKQEQAVLFGRMQQNIMLCKKYKVIISLTSFAESPYHLIAPSEMESVGVLLGLQVDQARISLDTLSYLSN